MAGEKDVEIPPTEAFSVRVHTGLVAAVKKSKPRWANIGDVWSLAARLWLALPQDAQERLLRSAVTQDDVEGILAQTLAEMADPARKSSPLREELLALIKHDPEVRKALADPQLQDEATREAIYREIGTRDIAGTVVEGAAADAPELQRKKARKTRPAKRAR